MECSLYIHIPFCTKKCDYCDFFSRETSNGVPENYIKSLKNEISFYAEKYKVSRWKTIYIGGGTPSLLSENNLKFILDFLEPQKSNELTLEVNPESLTKEKLLIAKNAGVSRLSVGIQSLNDSALQAVSRNCSQSQILSALNLIKSTWNNALNLDIIAGLPCQSKEEAISSLKKIVLYRPQHISLYTLTVEEETPLAKKIKGGFEFDYDKADEEWLLGRDILLKNGYTQYEVSNFCLSGFESVHNMTYWTQESYIGVGSGASGTIYDFPNALRWTNTFDINYWTNFWQKPHNKIEDFGLLRKEEKLSLKDLEFEFLMLGLRTICGVDAEKYKNRFSALAPWNGNLEARLKCCDWESLCREKKALRQTRCGTTNYSLTKEGLLFLNAILLKLL